MPILSTIVLAALILFAPPSRAAEPADWVLDRALPIETLEPDPSSLEDLAPLGDAIGDARFVELALSGSADNGAAYDAMALLIAYLHREHGFDLLVWGVGIFEGAVLDERLGAGASLEEASSVLYRVWRESRPVHRTLAYIRNTRATPAPLRCAGTLTQFHRTAKDLYADHLTAFLRAADPELAPASIQTRMRALWTEPARIRDMDPKHRNEALELARELRLRLAEGRAALIDRHGDARVHHEDRILANVESFVTLESLRAAGDPDGANAFRDSLEAENIRWLLEAYPDRKWILWGRGAGLREARPGEVYTIAFTGFAGELARPGMSTVKTLDPAASGTLEAILHATGLPHAFLDLRGAGPLPEWLAGESVSRLGALRGRPDEDAIDGIVFLDEVYPNFGIEDR